MEKKRFNFKFSSKFKWNRSKDKVGDWNIYLKKRETFFNMCNTLNKYVHRKKTPSHFKTFFGKN